MKFIVKIFKDGEEFINEHEVDQEPSIEEVMGYLSKYPEATYARVQKRLYKTDKAVISINAQEKKEATI